MKTIDVCYQGPFLDYSGYGEANRQALYALVDAGVNVNAKLVQYTMQQTDYGLYKKLIDECLNKDHDYQVKIMHVTPDEIPRLIDLEKYSISHFFWETNRVPERFVNGLSLVNEIWTGSYANLEAIRNSGIDTPVYIYPQAININPINYDTFNIDFNGFLFYSIFEWTDRKNPEALLEAYSKAFPKKANVGLLIKSYISNFSDNSKNYILNKINEYAKKFNIKNNIFFHHELMSYNQIQGLHRRGDCYVSAHRGEGWGVPQAEAITNSNPVITTGYGGINEYFENMVNGIVVPFTMVNVTGMSHATHYYSADQMWAEVDIDYMSEKMKFLFENQEEAAEIGRKAQIMAKEKLSYNVVGSLMRSRLEEIIREIQ